MKYVFSIIMAFVVANIAFSQTYIAEGDSNSLAIKLLSYEDTAIVGYSILNLCIRAFDTIVFTDSIKINSSGKLQRHAYIVGLSLLPEDTLHIQLFVEYDTTNIPVLPVDFHIELLEFDSGLITKGCTNIGRVYFTSYKSIDIL